MLFNRYTISGAIIFYVLAIAYIILNSIAIYNEFYYLILLPVVLLFAFIAFYRLDNFLLLLVFFVPLSIPLSELVSGLSIDLSLPTELMMVGITLIFFLKMLHNDYISKELLKHPVVIAIFFNLGWIFVTSLTSTMPLVSIKFFLSHLWFVVCFFFVPVHFFRSTLYIKKYLWIYLIPFLGIIIYSLYNLSTFGFFDKQAAHSVMNPFYNDHTSYGAIIAMFFPVLVGFIFDKEFKIFHKILVIFIFTLIIIGLVFSYCRAAWISIIVAGFMAFIIYRRVKISTIVLFLAIGVGVFFNVRDELMMKLEKNRTDSSSKITEHMQSAYNISSDASNRERINRWNSAFRMFSEKPLFGWGPGTYQFQYAPFQYRRDKTIISTNFGIRGNAHSEYIGPLSESGIPGTITFIAILITVVVTGIRVYNRSSDKRISRLTLCLLTGLITYFIHGTMNNFLDTDKASALFWGFIAMIVAMDLYKEKIQPQR